MTLPSLIKTWQYDVNRSLTAQGTVLADMKRIVRLLKNSLIGFGSAPWQIRGISNGGGNVVTTNYIACLAVGAGGPATDLWLSDNDLVWNTEGSAHSWVVLRQTGIGTHFEILLSCSSGTASNIYMSVSPSAGFTGGTGIARPIATDETVIVNLASWIGTTSDNNTATHVMMSSDGTCTRIFTYSLGVCTGVLLIDLPQNPVTGWTNPWAVYSVAGPTTYGATAAAQVGISKHGAIQSTTIASGSNSTALPQATINVASTTGFPVAGQFNILIGAAFQTITYTGVTSTTFTGCSGGSGTMLTGQGVTSVIPLFNFCFTGEAFSNATLIGTGTSQFPNDISGNFSVCPMGMFSTTIGYRGRHGSFFDLWWIPSSFLDGDTMPNDTTRTFVVVGDWLLPWNGTSLLMF